MPAWLRASASLLLFAAALYLLHRELRAVSVQDLASALSATDPRMIGAAAIATTASYACLSGTEWFSLRAVGAPLPFRRAASTACASYALSNTIGFSIATGTASRVRLYAGAGLSPGQAAAVALVAGMAVTFSGVVTTGLAVLCNASTYEGGAFGPAAVALVALTPCALWAVAFQPGAPALLGGGRGVELGRRARALWFACGVGDWVTSGLALYLLLPNPTVSAFAGFLGVFVIGSLVSALSGVPGGVGVFEAVVLTLTRAVSPLHETAAALLLYRLIYSVGPLCLMGLGLALRRAVRSRRRGATPDMVDQVAPAVLSVLTFMAGALLVLAASAWAPLASGLLRAAQPALPQLSPLIASLLGALLMLVAAGLGRRERAACFVAAGLALGACLFQLARGGEAIKPVVLAVLALALLATRDAFDRRSAAAPEMAWLIAGAGVSLTATTVPLFLLKTRCVDEPFWALFEEPSAPVSLRAVAAAALVLCAAGVWRVLRPRSARR